jgi:hypothetical protein
MKKDTSINAIMHFVKNYMEDQGHSFEAIDDMLYAVGLYFKEPDAWFDINGKEIKIGDKVRHLAIPRLVREVIEIDNDFSIITLSEGGQRARVHSGNQLEIV